MKRIKIIFWLILLLIMAVPYTFVEAATVKTTNIPTDYEDIILKNIDGEKYKNTGFVLTSDLLSYIGSEDCDWAAIGLGRFGYVDNSLGFLNQGAKYVTNEYKEKGKLHNTKSAEYSRFALAVLAQGGNPINFGMDKNGVPVDLIAHGTYNCLIGAPWENRNIGDGILALLAINSGKFAVPENALYSPRLFVESILKAQLANGGFTLKGNTLNPETTALAITALSPYYNNDQYATVKPCVDKSLNALSIMQNENGTFGTAPTAMGSAEVLVALCTMGINPLENTAFIKNGNTVLTGLNLFYNNEGWFSETVGGTKSKLANDKGINALIAYYRYVHNLRTFYDMGEEKPRPKTEISALSNEINNLPNNVDLNTAGEYFRVAHRYYLLNESDKNAVESKDKLLLAIAAIQKLQGNLEPVIKDPIIVTPPVEEDKPVVVPDEIKPPVTAPVVKPTPKPVGDANKTTATRKKTTVGNKAPKKSVNQVSSTKKPITSQSKPVTTGEIIRISNTKYCQSSDFPQGIVPQAEFETIMGKDQNLFLGGVTDAGYGYNLIFNGMDIKEPCDFNMNILNKCHNAKDIKRLSQKPFIFSLQHRGKLPGNALLEFKDLPLDDGVTLVFSYNKPKIQGDYEEKITVENHGFKFILTHSGDYFIADKVRAGSLLAADISAHNGKDSVGAKGFLVVWVLLGIFLLLGLALGVFTFMWRCFPAFAAKPWAIAVMVKLDNLKAYLLKVGTKIKKRIGKVSQCVKSWRKTE
ncbi:MAG: hypothetical protein RR233_09215 [Clostridiales bacterium]